MFSQELFWAGNQGNHQNLGPSMVPQKFVTDLNWFDNHIGWATPMPFASIYPINQRINPWNFGGFEKKNWIHQNQKFLEYLISTTLLVDIASHRSHCKKQLTPTVQIQEEQLQATMGQANKGYELQEVQNLDNQDKQYIYTILFQGIF